MEEKEEQSNDAIEKSEKTDSLPELATETTRRKFLGSIGEAVIASAVVGAAASSEIKAEERKNAPMKIKILINGDAICYLKDNFWNIVFISDENHRVVFLHDAKVPQLLALRKVGKDRFITLFADDPTLPAPTRGADFSKILNMAADIHGNGKLKIGRSYEPGREIISMMIPTGVLDANTLTDEEYYIEQISPVHNKKQHLGRQAASSIKLEMTLNSGRGLSMLIQDSEGASTLSFPFGEDLNLTFNNHCSGGCSTFNDFILYYDWLKDADDVNRKFVAGQSINTFSPLHGNCDPVVVEPPPDDPPQGP